MIVANPNWWLLCKINIQGLFALTVYILAKSDLNFNFVHTFRKNIAGASIQVQPELYISFCQKFLIDICQPLLVVVVQKHKQQYFA